MEDPWAKNQNYLGSSLSTAFTNFVQVIDPSRISVSSFVKWVLTFISVFLFQSYLFIYLFSGPNKLSKSFGVTLGTGHSRNWYWKS